MKKRTPQEKKVLSYAKDRRNTYGANDKSTRKAIPLRKARVNRIYRRSIDRALQDIDTNIDPETAELVENKARSIKRESWKKWPDEPLGAVVERNLEYRECHAGNGKTARKKANEFLKDLKIEIEQETDGRWIADAVEMNGVMAYGDSEETAILKCKHLAGIVYLESLGAIEILRAEDGFTSILTK